MVTNSNIVAQMSEIFQLFGCTATHNRDHVDIQLKWNKSSETTSRAGKVEVCTRSLFA